MTPSHTFTWSDQWLVGHTRMDDEHQALVELIQRMQAAQTDNLPGLLDEFEQVAQAHFAVENQWMESTEFPPRDCHIDEHMAVLKSVAEVKQLVRDGRVEIGIALVEELAKWFPSHVTHLDSALAHWMSKQQLGGKPVVIRRNLNLHHESV